MAKTTEIMVNGILTQVTQFDNSAQDIDDAVTRAKSGGAIDTALAGKAPAGYGLGTVAMDAPAADDGLPDADLITKTGFYQAVKNLSPSDGGNLWNFIIHTQFKSSGYAWQLACDCFSGCIRSRIQRSREWHPWEWVNPPMELGVEYRTTERYLGKPVYVKAVDLGTLVSGFKIISVDTPNVDTVIKIYGQAGANPVPFIYDTLDNSNTIFYRENTATDTIRIVTSVGASMAGKFGKCVCYYTKTTD